MRIPDVGCLLPEGQFGSGGGGPGAGRRRCGGGRRYSLRRHQVRVCWRVGSLHVRRGLRRRVLWLGICLPRVGVWVVRWRIAAEGVPRPLCCCVRWAAVVCPLLLVLAISVSRCGGAPAAASSAGMLGVL